MMMGRGEGDLEDPQFYQRLASFDPKLFNLTFAGLTFLHAFLAISDFFIRGRRLEVVAENVS
eukprot:336620-Hanusia_phi.AAC.2